MIPSRPRTKITATTPDGTITITAGNGLKRSYTWDGATRSVHMWPRAKRFEGRFGIYFPGPGYHWQEHNGVSRAVLEEAQLDFKSLDELENWITKKEKSIVGNWFVVYRNDGLMVERGTFRPRSERLADLRGDKKPTQIVGAQDENITVEYTSDRK